MSIKFIQESHSQRSRYSREPSKNIVGKLVSATFQCRKFTTKNINRKYKDKDRCALHTTYVVHRSEGDSRGGGLCWNILAV